MSEKFCLRWNDFEGNLSSAMKDLKDDEDFLNVTLVAGEGQVEAHKLVLSACSPFFRTVLKRNKHSHPLLYLKGVRYLDMVALLDFMYHGEVNIAQDDLNSFLQVAEDLKIKGLTQGEASRESKPRLVSPLPTSQPPDEIQEVTPPPVKVEPPVSGVVAEEDGTYDGEEFAEYDYCEAEAGYEDVSGTGGVLVTPGTNNKGQLTITQHDRLDHLSPLTLHYFY